MARHAKPFVPDNMDNAMVPVIEDVQQEIPVVPDGNDNAVGVDVNPEPVINVEDPQVQQEILVGPDGNDNAVGGDVNPEPPVMNVEHPQIVDISDAITQQEGTMLLPEGYPYRNLIELLKNGAIIAAGNNKNTLDTIFVILNGAVTTREGNIMFQNPFQNLVNSDLKNVVELLIADHPRFSKHPVVELIVTVRYDQLQSRHRINFVRPAVTLEEKALSLISLEPAYTNLRGFSGGMFCKTTGSCIAPAGNEDLVLDQKIIERLWELTQTGKKVYLPKDSLFVPL